MPEKQLNYAILKLPERSPDLTVFNCGNADLLLTTNPIRLPANHRDTHDDYEFLIPLTGIPHLFVDAHEIDCQPGCLVPINPGQLHGLKRNRRAISFISVFFGREWLEKQIRKFKNDVAAAFPNEPLALKSDVQMIISQLIAENRKAAPCRDYLLYNLTEQLAIKLIRYYLIEMKAPEALTPDQLSGEQQRFRDAIQMIRDHFCFPLTVAQLAERSGMNNYHFLRCFKRAFAMSPYHFIMQIRMQHAKILLGTTILPVAEVCRQCGFLSASRFSSLFREENGMPPNAYRQQHLNPEIRAELKQKARLERLAKAKITAQEAAATNPLPAGRQSARRATRA
jgi:AraC-like DNA-binding protein